MGRAQPLAKRGVSSERLTDKQRVFVHEYLVDLNGTRAAEVAGYSYPKQAAAKLLNKDRYPLVCRAIGNAQRIRLEATDLKAEAVLRELAYCVFRDPKDLCDEDGYIDIERIGELPERVRKAIDSVEVDETLDKEGNVVGRKTKVRLVPKTGALDMAMKHLSLYAGEKSTVEHHISWDSLYEQTADAPDTIEMRLDKEGRAITEKGDDDG